MFHNPLADGIVVIVILLLFFGPKRLPMLSRSIGESIKEFKGGISEATGKDSAGSLDSGETPGTTPRQPADTGAGHSS